MSAPTDPQPQRSTRSVRALALAVAALLVILLTFALLGPSNIDTKEQPGTTAFMADVADNGQWLIQHHPGGAIATKPPLVHWAGGVSLLVFGGGEFALKLPILLSFLGVCALVFALARHELGIAGALLAVAFFAAANPVFKLAHIARPDMPVALWLTLALLASLEQARAWRAGRRSPPLWLAVFWAAIALALLTKGQVALIGVAWLVALIIALRIRGVPIGRSRPLAQMLGFIAAAGLFSAWFGAVWLTEPEFSAMLERELVARTGAGELYMEGRTRQPWNVPAYVLSRFAPWSALGLVTALMLFVHWRSVRRQRRHPDASAPELAAPPAVAWALGYTLLVMAAFMTQPTHRPDHLLPIYPAAAVLAAAAVVHAARFAGAHRAIVGIVLMLVCALGVALPVIAWQAPPIAQITVDFYDLAPPGAASLFDPAPSPWRVWSACAIGAAAGLLGLYLLVRRRAWHGAGVAAAIALAGGLAVNKQLFSDTAREREGDAQVMAVRIASYLSAELDAPIYFYESGYTALQPLLGRNDPDSPDDITHVLNDDRPALILTDRNWMVDVYTGGESPAAVLAQVTIDNEDVYVSYVIIGISESLAR